MTVNTDDINRIIEESRKLPHDGYQGERTPVYQFGKRRLMRLLEKVAEKQHYLTLNTSGTEDQGILVTESVKL